MGCRSRLDRRLVRGREAKAGAQQTLLPPAAVRDSGRVYERCELCWRSLLFLVDIMSFGSSRFNLDTPFPACCFVRPLLYYTVVKSLRFDTFLVPKRSL